jgi:flagellar biosynthesis anti-sigma factor FlgM
MSIERLGSQATEATRTYLHTAGSARTGRSDGDGDRDGSTGGALRTDSVSLSANARSLAAARAAVLEAPDTRDARVSEIKQRVQDGTYSVPAHVLARKLLDASTNPQ